EAVVAQGNQVVTTAPGGAGDHLGVNEVRVERVADIHGGEHEVARGADIAGVGERAAPDPLAAHHKREVAVERDGVELHRAGDIQGRDDLARARGVAVDMVRVADIDHQEPADAGLSRGAGCRGAGDVQRLGIRQRQVKHVDVAAIARYGIVGGAVDVEQLI